MCLLATGATSAYCSPLLPPFLCCGNLQRLIQVGACLPDVLTLPASSCALLQALCIDSGLPMMTELLLALGRQTGCQAMSRGCLNVQFACSSVLFKAVCPVRWPLLQAFETLLWRWALPAEALPSLLFPGKHGWHLRNNDACRDMPDVHLADCQAAAGIVGMLWCVCSSSYI